MWKKVFGRRSDRLAGAQLCERCGQVCTQACRASAQAERTRTWATSSSTFLR